MGHSTTVGGGQRLRCRTLLILLPLPTNRDSNSPAICVGGRKEHSGAPRNLTERTDPGSRHNEKQVHLCKLQELERWRCTNSHRG